MDEPYRVVLGLGGQIPGLSSPIRARCGDHAPATRGNDLVAVEAEAGQLPELTHVAVVVSRSETLGPVFDERNTQLPAGFEKGVEIHRMAEKMNRHDRRHPPSRPPVDHSTVRDLATVLQELKHFSRVKLPGDRIHIHEDRVRPTVSDGIHRCDERQRWDQHLIVGPHSGDKQGDVQRDRPIGGRHRMSCADALSDLVLEALDEGSRRRYPAGLEALLHVRPLTFPDEGDCKRDGLSSGSSGHRSVG